MLDPRIHHLIDEVLDGDRTPEDACSDCPELLPELREWLKKHQAIERELDALFPSSPEGMISGECSTPTDQLPSIPGYELRSLLGRGGMGLVYLARQKALNRLVAIKMLITGSFARPDERFRFAREAEALAALRHPNVVPIFDAGSWEGRPFFAMEYIEGGTLATKLAGRPMVPRDAAELLVTLTAAIGAAHKVGIIHRDLKPGNVMLTPEGVPKISDFGLARVLDAAQTYTQTGAHLGTPSYMAPEQASGSSASAEVAVDVYALGAILYETLTGRPPFKGATAAETERQVIHDEPAPPSSLNAMVPRDLETVCLKCLRKEPSHRYVTAGELADDLLRFLRGEPIRARPTSPAERVLKWVRRYPAKAILIAITAVALVGGAGGTLWIVSARSAVVTAVKADLVDAENYLRASSIQEATAALDRASFRLGSGGSADVRLSLSNLQRDARLFSKLEDIHMRDAMSAGGRPNSDTARRDYEDALRSAGMVSPGEPAPAVATRIAQSPIAAALISAIDRWAAGEKDPEKRDWLVNIAGQADLRSPSPWRIRARRFGPGRNLDDLRRLAEEAPVATEPPSFLYIFGYAMESAGVDSTPFLRRCQAAHPRDFWLTSLLGNVLFRRGHPSDAAEYHRAAIALRPDTMLSHYNLAGALLTLKRVDEAVPVLREAIRLDPTAVDPPKSLAFALGELGQHEEALKLFGIAAQKDPGDGNLYLTMSRSQAALGLLDEAIFSFRRGLELGGKPLSEWYQLRDALIRSERLADAQDVWRRVLPMSPREFEYWNSYAELSLLVGNDREYDLACVVLKHCADEAEAARQTSIATTLLLQPSSPQSMALARRILDRTSVSEQELVSKPSGAEQRLARTLAEYRSGNFSAAASAAAKLTAPSAATASRLIAAMARYRLGETDFARGYIAETALSFGTAAAAGSSRDVWIQRILRREAELLIYPELTKVVQGERDAADITERLAALRVCSSSKRFGRFAQLAETLADARVSHTSEDIRALISGFTLAASAAGVDAGNFSEADRARWRLLAKNLTNPSAATNPASRIH